MYDKEGGIVYSIGMSPLLERVGDQGFQLLGNGHVNLGLSGGLCLESSKGHQEGSTIVCAEA